MKILLGRLLILVLLGSTASSAFANWHLTVRNDSQIPATVAQVVAANSTFGLTGTLGNAVVVIPGRGVVDLTDTAHSGNPCGSPHWGVRIVFNSQVWRFYYDGDGALQVTVNAAGTITLAGTSNPSQVVSGDNPPACR